VHSTVSVVIPFFQQEPGILARALRSVERQPLDRVSQIIIVDDASPVPAREELESIVGGLRSRIALVSRSNGGPGAARNTGLEHVASNVEYVAFLDSDDEWSDDHLSNALYALDKDFDLYFSDSVEGHEAVGHFETDCKMLFQRFEMFDRARELYVFPGRLFDEILSKSVIATSTAVYRYRALSDLRFRTDFRIGEDRFFWLSLLARTNRVVCTNRIGLRFGKGVNVYRSASWGDHQLLAVLREQIRMRRSIAQTFELGSIQSERNRLALRGHLKTFFANAAHQIVRGDLRAVPAMVALLVEYPGLFRVLLQSPLADEG